MHYLQNKGNIKKRALKNLGTFSTTTMEAQAEEIFKSYMPVNAVDKSTYPELEEFTHYCGKFLLDLFHAHDIKNYSYYATSGSSEAIFMSLLMMKHHWKIRHSSKNVKPYFVLSQTSHIAFKVAAKALDIELKILDYDENLLENLDQNCIGLCCTLGNTVTLQMEDVQKINQVLSKFYTQTDHFIPIHVDAASGGFVAPFYYPELIWDFRLCHVKAINVSSHKFGLVYPSLGWLCINNEYSVDDLKHEHSYLGKTFKRMQIQFSHSGSQLAAQYYNICSFGVSGYQEIITGLFQNCHQLLSGMKSLDCFEFITPNHMPAIPGIIFKSQKKDLNQLSEFLQTQGWHLPIFKLPDPYHQHAARIIVRYGFSQQLINDLLSNLADFIT